MFMIKNHVSYIIIRIFLSLGIYKIFFFLNNSFRIYVDYLYVEL